MDIRSAFNAATSAITTTSTQISVSSKNIANASVEGYTVKKASSQTTISGGMASGVKSAEVSSYVDQNLARSLMEATSTKNYSSITSTYLDSTLNQFGTPNTGGSVSHLLNDLEGAIGDLSVTPESQSLKEATVLSAEKVSNELNALSNTTQKNRSQADSEIDLKIDELNQSLKNIDQLNAEIVSRTNNNQSTADLEDIRLMELETVSGFMEVSYFTTDSNALQIYTPDGTPIVDSHARELGYTTAGNVTSSTAYPGGFSAITLSGKDITNSINGGKIGALIELRDQTLPATQSELDELAKSVIDDLNTALNTGTPNPPQNTISAIEAQVPANAFSGTGTMRLALVDSAGAVVSVSDLDLSLYATNQQVVNAMNALPGIDAAYDVNGYLTITSANPNMGVSLNEMDSAVGGAGDGVSSYFGLNNLFTGTSSDTISVRQDLLDYPARLSTGQLSDAAGLAAGDRAMSIGDTRTTDAMAGALSQDHAFNQTGDLDATTTSLEGYAADILASLSVQASTVSDAAETDALIQEDLKLQLSNGSGVNLDEETAKISALEEQYSSAAQVLSVLSDMFDSLLNAISK